MNDWDDIAFALLVATELLLIGFWFALFSLDMGWDS
jgi:hypothetical protein